MIKFPIQGAKWLCDIIKDPQRQYGIEIHKHLPKRRIEVIPYGRGTTTIRLPEQQELIERLEPFCVGMPETQILPDAYVATIENGTVVGNSGMIVTPDGYLIVETASMTGGLDRRCFSFDDLKNPNFDPPFGNHIKGRLLSLANPNGGYLHHVCESIIPLLWFNNHIIDKIHVVEGSNKDRVHEFLTDVKLDTNILVVGKSEEVYSADKVSFFAPNSYFLSTRSESIDILRKVLVDPFIRDRVTPRKKVYFKTGIKAGGASSRKVVNLEQLEGYLREQNYEFCDPATLTLPEKIVYMQDVDTVFSLYGSAPANILFSSNDEIKYIFIPRPFSLIPGNSMPINMAYLSHSDCPTRFVYPGQCYYNGYLMTGERVSRTFFISQLIPNAEFFPSLPKTYMGTNASEIDIKKFEEFYEHYLMCILKNS